MVYRSNTLGFEPRDSAFDSRQGVLNYTFEELVVLGVFEFAGIDDDGEHLWSINMERAEAVAPEIYWAEKNAIDEAILRCIELGFLEIDVDPDTLEVTYEVTEDGKSVL